MKYLLIIFVCLGTLFSCRSDSQNDPLPKTTEDFSIKIQGENNFLEKTVGNLNNIKLDLMINYDFKKIKTYFKFSNNLSGILKLNGNIIEPGKEYVFSNTDNTFEYTGSITGEHDLKFAIYNEKGIEAKKDFKISYNQYPTVTFNGSTSANIEFSYDYTSGKSLFWFGGFSRLFKVQTTDNAYITSVKYIFNYTIKAPALNSEKTVTKTYIESINEKKSFYEINNVFFEPTGEYADAIDGADYQIINRSLKIEAYNNFGIFKEITIEPTYTIKRF